MTAGGEGERGREGRKQRKDKEVLGATLFIETQVGGGVEWLPTHNRQTKGSTPQPSLPSFQNTNLKDGVSFLEQNKHHDDEVKSAQATTSVKMEKRETWWRCRGREVGRLKEDE